MDAHTDTRTEARTDARTDARIGTPTWTLVRMLSAATHLHIPAPTPTRPRGSTNSIATFRYTSLPFVPCCYSQLDGSIVLLSAVDLSFTLAEALGLMGPGGINFSFLRILRMLRVLRMLRLMKSWKGLYNIVATLGRTLPQMRNLFVLIFLLLLIFSLLGVQVVVRCV